MQRLRRLFLSDSVRPASNGWMPVVLTLTPGRAGHAFIEKACRRFEPQASVMACIGTGDLLLKTSVYAPDLVVVDPLACGPELPALLWQLRDARPTMAILALASDADIAALQRNELPGVDAALTPAELVHWLAEGLARLRCRVQLAALALGPSFDTTQAAELAPLP
ncbi:hypothetical protein [Eleftheria terrae]|uniref:hypothetical protein n=1 Tax=Eleftheria terrae TaxID=1597781 RepID=UPI00263B2379|nr:hypothetical protein [Eleftheria terrae]WKB52199.1 hypothetical protein N7L95_20755 [Eleftheria terrae]